MKNQNDHSGLFWNKKMNQAMISKKQSQKCTCLVLHVHLLGPWLGLYNSFVCDSRQILKASPLITVEVF